MKLVIFDCDGVLVDSETISNGVLARMLTDEGLPTTLEEARHKYQGLLLGEVLDRAQAQLDRPLPSDWLGSYERERTDAFRRELRPVPGATEAVESVVKAGVGVCVASQGKIEKTKLSLDLTGLRHLFPDSAIFSAHLVPRGKPHPDLFLHAATSMGAEPADCVVIEDTPSGAAAAVAAGMRVLGYAADGNEQALRESGAEVFFSLAELPRLSGALGGSPP